MSIAGFRAQNHPQQTGKRGAVDAVDDRGTDPEFIKTLEAQFGPFTLDVAASSANTKVRDAYYTADEDGLVQDWPGRVWCNPPYSDLRAWVQKAWDEWQSPRVNPSLIVMLLPANRTEQRWWQDLVEPYRDQPGEDLRVTFLPGRMRFDRPGAVIGPKGDRPPFGCCLLVWGQR